MKGVDIILILILFFGAYSGYKEGFLMSLFSLLGIILGVLGGFKLMGWAMVFLAGKFNIDQKVLPYFAFGFVFVGIVIAVSLLGRLLKLSIDKSFLGTVDQSAGALLGIIKAVFMLSVSMWLLDSLNVKLNSWREDSWLYPKIAEFAPATTRWVAKIFPVFRDIF